MPETVRLGFIGTGGIAQHHLRQLASVPEAQVVALCDVDEARVRPLAEPLGAAVYTDGARLIADAAVDAVYFCVPPHAHGDLEIQAARKGLHVFVEKPVNLYLDQAKAALAAIQEAGVMSQVGYSLRYMAGGVQLKEFLEGKQIGTAHSTRWNGLPGSPWWRRYDQSGGQLVEMTTHQVDLMRWVMGEVVSVSASYSVNRLFHGDADVTVPDSQAVLLHFASGASATINTACALGNGGQSRMDFVIRDAVVSWKGDSIAVAPENAYEYTPSPHDGLNIDSAFVRAVATGDRSLLRSPYEDGIKSAAVTLAANTSAEEGGRRVTLEELLG